MPTPTSPTTLKRQAAGRYATADGRFAVDQASGGWMVTDAEQANELGLPLVRGPFATLDEARDAIEAARSGPAPASDIAARMAALPKAKTAPRSRPAKPRRKPDAPPEPREPRKPQEPPVPETPPVLVREWRRGDGDALRALWAALGMGSIGDDDDSLATMARRNPGLLLVATAGGAIVGSVLGGWDGRRGWLYHVAVAEEHRRAGIARRLVGEVEDRLRRVGCRKVNVIVFDGNGGGMAFWEELGYAPAPTRQLGRVLDEPSEAP